MSKLKKLILLSSLLLNGAALGACQVDHYEFSVTISDLTFDQSYFGNTGVVLLKEGEDFAEVTNSLTGEVTRFDIGNFSNDGAGNFGIEAISSQEATFLDIFHDHETWHQGLEGYFTLPSGEIVELDSVRDCSYDQLFN